MPFRRNHELRALAYANREGECRVVCNVKLFTEGVDVPQLDAVAFLDPRDSQVDVVQAVGRVMRKAPGKRFGYIIIPVIVDPGRDVAAALQRGTEGYKTVGRVLRALQAHDGRLAESPARFIKVYEPGTRPIPRDPTGDGVREGQYAQIQRELQLKAAEQGIYAHVAAASGLGKPGQLVADEIVDAVKHASAVLQTEELEGPLAEALDLVPEQDGGAKGVCTVAALMLCNACLLQRRLRDEPQMNTILRLDKIAGASNPREVLEIAWEAILEKDYAPVFRPALAVVGALRDGQAIHDAIRVVAECANRVADSLSDLGYDHAGPLYHRILGSAKSDGAFYTNNLSAIMLARLALDEGFIDWSDREAVTNLRIIDPACGTGTLLMAGLQTIKARVSGSTELSDEERNSLHKRLVQDVLCGLDINQHGIQLAACNMTLGAPTVDYARMNLVTMPHGPQPDGAAKAGSLEILTAASDALDLNAMTAPRRSLETLDAAQVDDSQEIVFPLHKLDAVIMNAPFTDNLKRGRKFGTDSVKAMQRHELDIRDRLHARDPAAGGVITTDSIRSFFTPLADQLLRRDKGALAKVIPVTACTSASGTEERRFLADRFHVEHVVTTHDPKRINFSENTSIHESLLICRRWPEGNRPPTRFVSLRRMPNDADEARTAADAIASGRVGSWGRYHHWPSERVRAGDWTPVQWYDGMLADAVRGLEKASSLEPLGLRHHIGPMGRAAQNSWRRCGSDEAEADDRAVRIFDTISAKVRGTLAGDPEQWVIPGGGKRVHLWQKILGQGSTLLVAERYNTVSGRLTALYSEAPTFGFGWRPVATSSREVSKAICLWLNSTPGRMLLLNRRAKMLTYPQWSTAHWKEVSVPKNEPPAYTHLAEAFDTIARRDLKTLQFANSDDTRIRIDEAVASALGFDPEVLAHWRRRLAAEPTITNRRAPIDLGQETHDG